MIDIHKDLSAPYAGIEILESREGKMFPWLKAKADMLPPLIEGEKILEIGCGIGSLTQFPCKTGAKVVACDISEPCVMEAFKRGIPAEFITADVCNTKYWQRLRTQFDMVVMSDVLDNVYDTKKAMENIWMLLRKSGVLIITVPVHRLLYSWIDNKIGHLRRYSKRQIAAELVKLNLRVERCNY